MKVKDLTRFLNPHSAMPDILTDDDIESVLRSDFRLSKSDLTDQEWQTLLETCSRLVRSKNLYQNDRDIIKNEVQEYLFMNNKLGLLRERYCHICS